MSYELHLVAYEGPMDMLLELIRKEKIDIRDIPIARVADEFLKEMEKAHIAPEQMSDFLVMAATLLEIKSKMHLPRQEKEEEEDPRLDLVERLVLYKMFKEAAETLGGYEREEKRAFHRKTSDWFTPREEISWKDGSPQELAEALAHVLKHRPTQEEDWSIRVQPELFPVARCVERVRGRILEQPQVSFTELFGPQASREEVLSFFLAGLELSNGGELRIFVERGEIFFERRNDE